MYQRMILLLVVVAVVLGVALISLAIMDREDAPEPIMIYRDRSMTIRAVCTEGSGLIVTTVFNSAIAGDAVSSMRMTPDERVEYCE